MIFCNTPWKVSPRLLMLETVSNTSASQGLAGWGGRRRALKLLWNKKDFIEQWVSEAL